MTVQEDKRRALRKLLEVLASRVSRAFCGNSQAGTPKDEIMRDRAYYCTEHYRPRSKELASTMHEAERAKILHQQS